MRRPADLRVWSWAFMVALSAALIASIASEAPTGVFGTGGMAASQTIAQGQAG